MWRHFFFSKWTGKDKVETIVEENPVVVSAPQHESVLPSRSEIVLSTQAESVLSSTEEQATEEAKTERGKVFLSTGKTLRLLALDLFGDREFWVYIYLENKNKISNPNKVPSGIELIIPDRLVYSIDASNPQSISRAKSLGKEILDNF